MISEHSYEELTNPRESKKSVTKVWRGLEAVSPIRQVASNEVLTFQSRRLVSQRISTATICTHWRSY